MRIVYMGTPEFSVSVLEGLLSNNYNIVGVVTQPDKLVGRKQELKYSAVKEVAVKHNIPVFQPTRIRTDYQNILDLKPDIIITCAYGQIIPKEILDFPKYGCINVHASLLPKLRGGAPIHHAIIDGYDKTGITIMKMGMKMDDGDIISRSETKITLEDTVGILHDRLKIMGRDLLLETLPRIINNDYNLIKQDEQNVTFGYNITREDEHINFDKPNIEVFNQIRGLNPFPGAYAVLDEKVMKIYDINMINDNKNVEPGTIVKTTVNGFAVQTKNGLIEILKVKPEGKKVMSSKDYLNGISNIINKKFE